MKKIISSTIFGLTLIAFSSASVLASSSFFFRSHQATYEMKDRPQAVRNWSSIQNADGVMRYQINNTCDGWTVENNTALFLDYGTGQPVEMAWSYSSFETRDGNSLQFSSRTKRNDQIIENISGIVSKKDGEMVLTYKQPEEKTVVLPKDTLFPTNIVVRALKEAQNKVPLFTGSYFDGSGQDQDMFVSIFTAPSKEAATNELAGQKIAQSPLWDVDMAFYQPGADGDQPDLEIGAKMREDGITTVLFQDFSDFSMDGTLTDLKLLEEPECD